MRKGARSKEKSERWNNMTDDERNKGEEKDKRDQRGEKHHLKMDENTPIEVIRNLTLKFACKNSVIVGDVSSCG